MRLKYLLPTLLLMWLFWGCKSVKDPEFRGLEKFKVKKMGLLEVTIGLNVVFFNPNNFGVTAKEAAADIYIDSVYFGRFVQDSAVFVTRNADFAIPISGSIPLQTALKMNFQDLPTRDISIRAEGSVKVGKSGFFVTRPIQYSGVHRLDELK